MKNEGGLRTKGYLKESLKGKPLITVVTVVYNGEKFIEETILSVINQTYDNVEYIIMDGGSTDETINILKKYEEYIDYWVSEKDAGMYDALHKGFKLGNGSIYSWINSDDIYEQGALKIVADTFIKHKIDWLTAVPSVIDVNGNVISVEYPFYYHKHLIRNGLFRGDMLGFIQQESTFFSSKLYWKSPLNTSYKFAGDYHLWCGFANYSKLYTLKTTLAYFRIHNKQLSSDKEKYYQECDDLKINFLYKNLVKINSIKKMIKSILILSNKKMIRIDLTS